MSQYSIRDLEHLSGIKAHTIRIWEQRYGLFTPKRTATNIRYYSDQDLKHILNISTLKSHGFKISNIVQMTSHGVHSAIQEITHNDQFLESYVNALTVSMIDLDEDQFNKVLNDVIERHGFEKMMNELIYPFMKQVGVLWLTNEINPAQEHFISHLIRQKIIAETEKLPKPPKTVTFLLFLPEGELHEMGILFANYMLKSFGFKTLYFGQTVPLKALMEVYHRSRPNYLLTTITSKPPGSNLESFLQILSESFEEARIFISGPRLNKYKKSLPHNMEIIKQFDDLKGFCEELL